MATTSASAEEVSGGNEAKSRGQSGTGKSKFDDQIEDRPQTRAVGEQRDEAAEGGEKPSGTESQLNKRLVVERCADEPDTEPEAGEARPRASKRVDRPGARGKADGRENQPRREQGCQAENDRHDGSREGQPSGTVRR